MKQSNLIFVFLQVKSNYMVKLHRHFDTINSIFLLLEYASGGCLWGHMKTLRRHYSPYNEMPDGIVAFSNDTFADNEHNPDVNESTETGAECTSVGDEGGNSKEVVGNKLNLKEISSNSQGNILNSASEPFKENLSSNNDTAMKSRTAVNPNGLSEEKTCLKPDKALVEQTGQTCLKTCRDVFGSLDHVANDRSAVDKCVQYWIADLLLAINSVHSCGIILK